MGKWKQASAGLAVGVGLLAVAFSGWTLWKGQAQRYRQEGYAAALSQMVEASKTEREVTVTVGEETVKFVVVTPATGTAITPSE